MMSMRMPETCSAVFKQQVINLGSCCILLVDSVESMMMHGLANPKSHALYIFRKAYTTPFQNWKKYFYLQGRRLVGSIL